MTYGIVLLPDVKATKAAIGFSRAARHLAEDPDFVLGTETNIPHISMIHFELDEWGLEKAKAALAGMKAWLKDFPLPLVGTLEDLKLFGQWFFWLAPRTPQLDRLHRECVERFSPLRCGDVDIGLWKDQMDEAQRRNYQTYGHPLVLEAFNPHMTLGILRKGVPAGGIAKTAWSGSCLALAALSGDGQGRVIGVLDKLPLLHD